jgi:glutathione S-transferase
MLLIIAVEIMDIVKSSTYKIVIGNKRYSSWSLRGWLGVKYCLQSDEAVSEILCKLAGADSSDDDKSQIKRQLLEHSPSGKVPALIDNEYGIVVYDSLAICLHLALKHPERNLLPTSIAARGLCLSAASEMHSGFTSLRNNWPMIHPAIGRKHGEATLDAVREDINRLDTLWCQLRSEYGEKSDGPFLFGKLSVSDIMFAPVAIRFKTYDPDLTSLSPKGQAYVSSLYSLDGVQEWVKAASLEDESLRISSYEKYVD